MQQENMLYGFRSEFLIKVSR